VDKHTSHVDRFEVLGGPLGFATAPVSACPKSPFSAVCELRKDPGHPTGSPGDRYEDPPQDLPQPNVKEGRPARQQSWTWNLKNRRFSRFPGCFRCFLGRFERFPGLGKLEGPLGFTSRPKRTFRKPSGSLNRLCREVHKIKPEKRHFWPFPACFGRG